jgi:high-affinity Fe2+/Pb2+ permease
MLRLFIIALLFYLIIWLVRGYDRGKPKKDENETQELVRDAHSGLYFPKSESISITREGETFYFVSVESRDKFLASRR